MKSYFGQVGGLSVLGNFWRWTTLSWDLFLKIFILSSWGLVNWVSIPVLTSEGHESLEINLWIMNVSKIGVWIRGGFLVAGFSKKRGCRYFIHVWPCIWSCVDVDLHILDNLFRCLLLSARLQLAITHRLSKLYNQFPKLLRSIHIVKQRINARNIVKTRL